MGPRGGGDDWWWQRGFTPYSISRLHRTLRTGVDRIQRRRAADIKSVPLLTAEAQVRNRFRDMDLAEQIAFRRVAAPPVLVRIAPADRAPQAPGGVAAQSVGNAGLG